MRWLASTLAANGRSREYALRLGTACSGVTRGGGPTCFSNSQARSSTRSVHGVATASISTSASPNALKRVAPSSASRASSRRPIVQNCG